MFNDLTILICSYNQKEILHRSLQSLIYHHPYEKFKILVVENSDNDDIIQFLSNNDIMYWPNQDGDTRHSPSVELGLKEIQFKYCLLWETDCILNKPMNTLFNKFLANKLDLAGEWQGDRGGYKIHPRLAPNFLLMNLDNIKSSNIHFHDEKRIKESGSEGFFKNVPLQNNEGKKYYDCGSSFFEDCLNNNLRVADLGGIKEFVTHYEGMSWRTKSGIPQYEEWGRKVYDQFMKETEIYKDVDIKGKFGRYI